MLPHPPLPLELRFRDIALDGHQPAGLTATQLIERADLPMSWREQRRTLGFA